jgi:hypothetical protein
MVLQKEDPALGAAAGLPDASLLGSLDTQDIAPKPAPAQDKVKRNPVAVLEARLELMRDDLVANITQASLHFDVALAMLSATDDVGLLYALRRVRAYWQSIAADAKELAAIKGASR